MHVPVWVPVLVASQVPVPSVVNAFQPSGLSRISLAALQAVLESEASHTQTAPPGRSQCLKALNLARKIHDGRLF